MPDPSLTCLPKYLRFIWQDLPTRLIVSVISDFLSLNEKLNCAALNKMGILAHANCENLD